MKSLVRDCTRALMATAVLICSCFAYASAGFSPQSGTWIVSSELDGKPGRGMAIDVQDGTMVMQVYNYREDGAATFYLAIGNVVDNQVSAPLKRYKGGRFFGSGPLSGVEDGDAGMVNISFTSGGTGIVQFPGEQAVAMERYRFEGVSADKLADKLWLLALLDENGNAAELLLANTQTSDETGNIILNFARSVNSVTTQTQCQYSLASYSFRCFGSGIQAEFKEYIRQLSGTLQAGGKTYRMVGTRLADFKAGSDVPGFVARYAFSPAPESGTWVVSSEVDGKPGRGMAIDVQSNLLVMQVYNYDATGNATFHLAVGPYKDLQSQGPLKRYQGGRWFGSGPRSGMEAGDAGMVYLAFDTPTRGVVRFPGEGPLAIQRYRFGVQAPDPQSLLGTWAFYDETNDKTTMLRLTEVVGNTAKGGGVLCSYTDTVARQVRCAQGSAISREDTRYIIDYRFTNDNGIAFGKALLEGTTVPTGSMPSDSKAKSLTGMRIVDRHGVHEALEMVY
ncbi:hypothetical protein [Comamonas odontotermitis]|uniref:hypothetical protein n=1 Tax=Comamonas odontotermitis TaxID=379895 RepID=UPI001CC5CCC6|nr:hypothetical protein [Comamonas odontotermitis]UBB16121.1 hypothetical protein LAD35_14990 [Comamonas odontotermitis]